jgi:hypothetical protein
LATSGYEPEYGTPAAYRSRVAMEIERLRTIATQSKISVE